MKNFSLFQQIMIKRIEIITYHLLDNWQVDLLRLQDYQSTFPLSSCSTTYLRQHHESMFIRPEIGIIQHIIRIENSNDRNIIEV